MPQMLTEQDKALRGAIVQNQLDEQTYQGILNRMGPGGPAMTPVAPTQAPLLNTAPAIMTPAAPMPSITSIDQLTPAAPQPAPEMTPQMPVSKDLVQSYKTGFDLQKLGIQQQANAVEKMNIESAKIAVDLGRQMDQVNYDIMQENEAKNARIAEVSANIDQLRQNYAEAKIDPDRLFAGNTGKRVLAGIAIAFGAVGQALTGAKENQALSIINKAIDDDIAAQKEGMANKYNQYLLARQNLADVKDIFKDRVDQQLAQKVMYTEAAQAKIGQIAARYNTQEAQAKAQVLIGQLEQSKAEALGKMFDMAAKKVQAAPLTEQQMKAVGELSSAYEGNEGIKSYGKIDLAYRKMENLVKLAQTNPNAAQAIITTFNRVLDENSVVREAEVNLTMQAGSVVDRFRQQAEKAISGKMTPEQAQNLLDAARQLRDAALDGKQRLDQRFIERSKAFGVPAELVISTTPEQAVADQKRFLMGNQQRTGGR